MKFAVFLLAIVAAAYAACPFSNVQAAQAELKNIERAVNANTTATWNARVNQRFFGMTFEQIKSQLGSLSGGPKLERKTFTENMDIPERFVAGEEFPECKNVIERLVDQSACGSCWAMAVASAATHRLCIASQGKISPQLSARDLLSCCGSCGFGCQGGYPEAAWSWLTNTGIVTGENYQKYDQCVSYPFQPCGHHVDTFEPPCSALDYDTPKCQKACDSESSYATPYSEDKVKFSRAFSLYGEKDMQMEIMKNGPISVAFTVYSDFLNYKNGVYSRTGGSVLGGHAVTAVGWTVVDGVKAWICQNSWNESWGTDVNGVATEGGYFLIRRGNDECGIESSGAGATINL